MDNTNLTLEELHDQLLHKSDTKVEISISTLFTIYNAGFTHGVNEGPFPEHGTFNEFHNTIAGKPVCGGPDSWAIREKIKIIK